MINGMHDSAPGAAGSTVGQAFGTFGELLQGVLPEDRHFLVTLPIRRFSTAVFTPLPAAGDVVIVPAHKAKSQRLARRILDYFQLPPGGRLAIDTDLPEGKGFASSSADLVATARAIERYAGRPLPSICLYQFLAEIEPSDGVMHPGITLFYHREVQLGAELGMLPPLAIVSIDEGGEIDTIEFNKARPAYRRELKQRYRDLLDDLVVAVEQQDLAHVGAIATMSARLHQPFHPKRTLDCMIELCGAEEVHGLGVVIAHSGTLVGILLAPGWPDYAQRVVAARQRLEGAGHKVTVYETFTYGLPVLAADWA